jgi:hypothetical protein
VTEAIKRVDQGFIFDALQARGIGRRFTRQSSGRRTQNVSPMCPDIVGNPLTLHSPPRSFSGASHP